MCTFSDCVIFLNRKKKINHWERRTSGHDDEVLAQITNAYSLNMMFRCCIRIFRISTVMLHYPRNE